jgi:SsrA-binding protein
MPIYSTNKRASFDYTILKTYEAGLVLTGQEVKSVRAGHAKLAGAFVTFHGANALLTNAHIPKYSHTGTLPDYDPTHSRKLLLSKKEIDSLRGKSGEAGLTIIPLSLYTKGRYIKVEIGVAKGKKTYDKRETIKKREVKREMQRGIKERQ